MAHEGSNILELPMVHPQVLAPRHPGFDLLRSLVCTREEIPEKKYQWLIILKERVLTMKRLVHRNCKHEREHGQTNRVTDGENKLMVTRVGEYRVGWTGRLGTYKIDK